MRKLALALVIAVGFLAAQSASATTYENYVIRGNSCISITGGQTPEYNQYGVNAPGTSAIDVTCPLTLPDNGFYTYAYLLVNGYNRSPDRLYCTIASTDYAGLNQISSPATLPYNQQPPQVWSTSISPSPSSLDIS
jgi:hypothetical protein